MRILYIVSVLIIVSLTSVAQEVKKYQGPYVSGIGLAGEAVYFYYPGKRPGDQVRHGNFRYTMKFKDGDKRLYQTIEGAYKHGSQDGKWIYSLNTRDFIKENQGLLSGNIAIKVAYSDGIPNGRWEYQSTIRHRKAQGSGSLAFTAEVKESFVVNFTQGMLTDSFYYESSDGRKVEGLLPKSGMLHGKFTFSSPDQTKEEEYFNGIFIGTKTWDSEQKLLGEDVDKSQQQLLNQLDKAIKAKTASSLDFTTDTLDKILDPSNELTRMLLLRFFNETYSLIQFVPGNTRYYFENGKPQNRLKGLRMQGFKNQIITEQSRLLAQIAQTEAYIARIENDTRKQLAGRQLSKEAQARLQQFSILLTSSKRNYCLANSLCQHYIFHESLTSASEVCQNRLGGVSALPPSIKTRNDALNYLLQQQQLLEKSATESGDFILKDGLK